MPWDKRRSRVVRKPDSVNGWASGEKIPGPVRRRLRDATLFDRFLIGVFIFVVAAFVTGAIYWRASIATKRSEYQSHTILAQKTGNAARVHFLLVCAAGGAFGVLAYFLYAWRDPYGTAATAKAEAESQARKDRFAFLANRDEPSNPDTPIDPQ